MIIIDKWSLFGGYFAIFVVVIVVVALTRKGYWSVAFIYRVVFIRRCSLIQVWLSGFYLDYTVKVIYMATSAVRPLFQARTGTWLEPPLGSFPTWKNTKSFAGFEPIVMKVFSYKSQVLTYDGTHKKYQESLNVKYFFDIKGLDDNCHNARSLILK